MSLNGGADSLSLLPCARGHGYAVMVDGLSLMKAHGSDSNWQCVRGLNKSWPFELKGQQRSPSVIRWR